MFGDTYRGRRVLLTGHTGFKGSWLASWLELLGADLCGVSLAPESDPNHWSLLKLDAREALGDIRESAWLREIVRKESPEIIFHLAAQSLVRKSYRSPLDTWSTNVLGTANLLDACRDLPGLKAVVIVTTDKVYENNEWCWGYRENDRLGGHDPYSASKAGTELVVSSYRKSFLDAQGVQLASARAGNVIGGGDWCEDRLIPDLVRAVAAGHALSIRSPKSTRPWQHVLECLSGYLQLGQHLLANGSSFAEAWNFGPDASDNRTVEEILTRLHAVWPVFEWKVENQTLLHEANLLYLDNSKAKASLGWRPVWSLQQTLQATGDWYRAYLERGEVCSQRQIKTYMADARACDVSWSAA